MSGVQMQSRRYLDIDNLADDRPTSTTALSKNSARAARRGLLGQAANKKTDSWLQRSAGSNTSAEGSKPVVLGGLLGGAYEPLAASWPHSEGPAFRWALDTSHVPANIFLHSQPPGPHHTGAVKAYEVRSRRVEGSRREGWHRDRNGTQASTSVDAFIDERLGCSNMVHPASHARACRASHMNLTACWNEVLVLAYVPAGSQCKRGRSKA